MTVAAYAATVTHMSNPLPLAQVVADALAHAGLSQNATATATGIPRETLRRRLADGDFKHGELWRIADVLDTTPAVLVARAEGRAA